MRRQEMNRPAGKVFSVGLQDNDCGKDAISDFIKIILNDLSQKRIKEEITEFGKLTPAGALGIADLLMDNDVDLSFMKDQLLGYILEARAEWNSNDEKGHDRVFEEFKTKLI
jgi:hypothetical protein